MPIVKLLNRCCKTKLDNRSEVLLRNSLNKINKEQYREIYNILYDQVYKHKKFKVIDEIKIFISSIKEAH